MFGILGVEVVRDEIIGKMRSLEIDLSGNNYINKGRKISSNSNALKADIYFGYDIAPTNYDGASEEGCEFLPDDAYYTNGDSKMRLGLGGLYYRDLTEKKMRELLWVLEINIMKGDLYFLRRIGEKL
ncbi:MAG: hypothetical protein DRP06_03145 [Candidatus Aenigmatarchaeota archaeon]|nr:MAG: hypothetical protein DRP06_03145 [Candidatus Aenigmarchaeota archaeon]